jgi:hypothetical protein
MVNKIHEAIETKQYCSAAFLDISQAFDKVWHTGLLYKLRKSLPLNYFLLLESYLNYRHFRVKVGNEYSDLLPVHAGVPQGSVLDPLLYLFYTSDLTSSPDITTATFADDTAILAIDASPAIASQKLQNNLDAIQHWLSLWRLKANGSKSTHVAFTNRIEACSVVYINNELSFKQRMSNILEFIWANASPGINLSSLSGNTWALCSLNSTGYSDVGPRST